MIIGTPCCSTQLSHIQYICIDWSFLYSVCIQNIFPSSNYTWFGSIYHPNNCMIFLVEVLDQRMCHPVTISQPFLSISFIEITGRNRARWTIGIGINSINATANPNSTFELGFLSNWMIADAPWQIIFFFTISRCISLCKTWGNR